jgi:hypothetical protein
MEMTSFSEKEDERDKSFFIKAKFDSLDTLVNFLDMQGRHASVKHEGGITTLSLNLGLNDESVDPDIAPLLPVIFNGYYMDFKISFPLDCKVSYADEAGNALPALPYGETVVAAKTVSVHAPMADILAETGAVSIMITW